jgi:hypothetical protein
LKIKNPTFSKFITLDLLNNSINLGYPRPEGKAKVYKMMINPNLPQLQFYRQFYDLNDHFEHKGNAILSNRELKQIINNFNESFPNLYGKINELSGYKQHNKHANMRLAEDLAKGLIVDLFNNYVIEAPIDIVKGDVIIANFNSTDEEKYELEVKMIYNGACRFIGLDGFRLPFQFRVLENGVPMKYWISDEDGQSTYKNKNASEDNYRYYNRFASQYVNINLRDNLEEIMNNAQKYTPISGTQSKLKGYRLAFLFDINKNKMLEQFDIGVFMYDDLLDIFVFNNGVTDYF